MENEPKKPDETTNEKQQKNDDAAAMSARILAMQSDSDEYTYEKPSPRLAQPIMSPKQKRRGVLTNVLGVVGIFLLGSIVSIPIAKMSISRGYGIGIRLERWFGTPPVAIVNGDEISASEFADACEIPSGRTVLQRLIDDRLVQQYARKLAVYPEQQEVDAKYTELSSAPAFFQNLKRSNETPEDFKHTLLITMCKQAIVSKGIKVNPDEIQDYYKKNIDRTNKTARFFHPESVQVSVIVNPSRVSLEMAQKDIAGGMSWAAAVLKYSADASKAHSGVLPPLRRNQIDAIKFPGLGKAIFDLQLGNTSDITRIGKYYWLIKCIGHNPETIDPFEKVQDLCKTGLLVERGIKNNGKEITKEEEDFVKASSITFGSNYADRYGDVSPKK